MGSKQTKLEGEYLPQMSHQPPHKPITVQTDFGSDLEDILDPRSPHICRTPLNEIVQKPEKSNQQKSTSIEQPFSLLRKRFFKGFSHSLNDPRSPSVFNRTPIVFDETLNLDDTFSDLFAETKAQREDALCRSESTTSETPVIDVVEHQEEKEVEEEEEEEKTEEIELATPKITKTTPQETIIEQDPRSPSIGVERTPIILNDDDAPDEDDMIETILSTLSLNKTKMPANKPLDRIRNKKTNSSKVGTSSTNRKELTIYKDRENRTPAKAPRAMDSPSAAGKRTPLSCVKNNPQFKSKSVEVSGKTMKARLALTSFDDSLHKITPVKKILRYSNMENIENSFEF